MWRKLLKYRSVAKSFCRVEVQSGQQTFFWFDNWSDFGCLYDLLGERGFIELGINSKATVADVLFSHRRRRRRHRFETLNNIEVALDKYRGYALPTAMDVALWRGADGKFSPKFVTMATWEQIRHVGEIADWTKGLWFSAATPKYSFMGCLATHNRLTTGDRMQAWNVGASPTCVLCNAPLETHNHLFFECPYSSTVWEQLTDRILQHQYTVNYDALLALIAGQTFQFSICFILRYVFQATVHSLWCEQNNRRHGVRPLPPDTLVKNIDRMVRNRFISLLKQGQVKFEASFQLWLGSR